MIPAEIIELMHGEIDGANSTSDSECLHAYLAEHPDVRVQYQELREAVGIFCRLAPLEPPENLRQRISDALDAVDASRHTPRFAGRASPAGSWRVFWSNLRTRWNCRHAFALGLVGGLLLSATAWQLIGPGWPPSPDDLRATVMNREASRRDTGSRIMISDVPGVTGDVRIAQERHETLIRLDLSSVRPVQIRLLGDEDFFLGSYGVRGPFLENLSIDGRRITLTHQGSGTHDVVLHHLQEEVPTITLQIRDDGAIIWERVIRRERN